MAPAVLRAVAAAIRKKATAGPLMVRTTAPPISATGPLTARSAPYSTGKRRGKLGKVCRYDDLKIQNQFSEINKNLADAKQERADLAKGIKDVEAKQAKPWFSATIKGRPMDMLGAIALVITVVGVVTQLL